MENFSGSLLPYHYTGNNESSECGQQRRRKSDSQQSDRCKIVEVQQVFLKKKANKDGW